MPSEFFDFHRSRTGDQRSNDEILVEVAERNPELLDKIPGLRDDYDAFIKSIREPYTPSLTEEFTSGLERGARGLSESLYGFGALGAKVFGADKLAGELALKSQRQGELAAEAAGSVPSYKDIHNASSLGRYLLGGIGEVLPSAAEAAVLAAGGALAGGAVANVPGAGGGAITGLVARQAAKSLVRKGVKEITKDLVAQEAKAIARRYGAYLGTALNSYALSSGEIYADLVEDKKIDPDRAVNAALLGGFVAAVPDTVLPSYVAGKFLKGVAGKEVAKETKHAFYAYLLRLLGDASKTVPIEAATEGFQEWVNVAAGHWAKGDAPVFGSLTKAEQERVINASALGAIGGGVFAPVAAISGGSEGQTPPPAKPPATPATPPAATPPATPATPTVPIPPGAEQYFAELEQADRVQLEAMARQELSGRPLTIEQRATLEKSAPLKNAYTIIKTLMGRTAPPVREPGETELDYGAGGVMASSAGGQTPGQPTESTPTPPVVPAREPDESELEYGTGGELIDYPPPPIPEITRQTKSTAPPSPPAAPETITGPPAGQGENEGKASAMPAEAGASPAPVQPIRKGRPRGTDRPPDIIDHILNYVGKIKSISSIRPGSEDLYDSAREIRKYGAARQILSSADSAIAPDKALQSLIDYRFLHPDASVGDMWNAIEAAAKARKGDRETSSREKKLIEVEERQHMDFVEAGLNRRLPGVAVTDLIAGDKFTLNGTEVRVQDFELDENGDVTAVILDDGRRYGTQRVGANEIIRPDQGSLQRTQEVSFAPDEELGATVAPPVTEPPKPAPATTVAATAPEPAPSQSEEEKTSPMLDESAMEDLLDDLDIELFDPKKTTHGHTSEVGFFRVLKQPFSVPLGERLTRNFRTGDNKSNTRQIVFFHDTKTGEVVGLGTMRSRSKMLDVIQDEFRVGRLPGKKLGSTLRKVMEDWRYVPIASMTRKTPDKYSSTSFRFKDLETFEAFAKKAEERLRDVAAQAQNLPETAVEYDDGKKTDVVVDDNTPADELAAQEGFTNDEADAIYKALAGVKPLEIGAALIRQQRNNEDLRHAMQMAARIIVYQNEDLIEKGELSEEEIGSFILSKIAEAQGRRGAGKKAFIQSLTQSFGEKVRDGVKRERSVAEQGIRPGQEGSTQQAAATPATAGIAGAEPSTTAGPGEGTPGGVTGREVKTAAQTAAQDQAAKTADERFHRGTFEEKYRPPPNAVAAAFQSAISALANAGFDVNLIRAEMTQLLAQFGGEFGIIDNANQVVSLVMANTAEPTIDNLYHLNAEISHAVFAGLSTQEQERLQAAIRGATDEMLGIKGPFTISESVPESQRESVEQEERLVDVVARNITAQGFNAAEANSLAQRFWRFLRGAMLRAATALGKAWGLVSPQAQAKLASAYLQVRVEQFLAGKVGPYSFTDFMGGGRATPQDANANLLASNGETSVQYRYNAETGQIEVQEVLADSPDAALSNFQNPTVRYHGPKSRNALAQPSADLGPEIIRFDIASNNEVKAAVNDHFLNWQNNQGGNVTSNGVDPLMTPADFSKWVLDGVMEQPDVTIGELNDAVMKLGQAAQNPNLRVADLNPEAQKNAAAKAYNFFSRITAKWGARHEDAAYQTSQEPGSAQRRYYQNSLRLQNLVNNYPDAFFMFDEVKNEVVGWAEFMKKNAEDIGTLAHRDGVLEQVIRDVEGRLDKPLSNDYYATINKLVNRFATNDGTKVDFVEMLQAIAATGIPWEQMSAKQITEALKNPELEQATAGTFDLVSPEPKTLALLRESSMEGRALRSIAAAFLKRNALLTEFLGLRGSKANEDRTEVNAALKMALGHQKEALQLALRSLKKTNKLNERATRLLVRIEQMKEQQKVALDNLAGYRHWMSFYEGSTGLLTKQMAAMEKIIGAVSEEFEAVSGAILLTAENPNEPPESIIKRSKDEKQQTKYSVGRDGMADDRLRKEVAAMQAWLDANQTTAYYGSNVYNRLASQVEKIRENDAASKMDKGSRSLMQAAFSPVVTKLEATGIPAFKSLARQFRKWITYHDRYKQEAVRWATQWSNSANQARKALGYSGFQFKRFLERYYDPSWDYISRRLDLQVGSADHAEAETKAYAALRSYHSSLTTDQWRVLEGFLRKTAEISDELMKAAESMGIKIEDKNFFRRARGARTYEVSRKLHGTIRRIFKKMNGEPGTPGPWSGSPFTEIDPVTGKDKKRDLAAEYRKDPTTLRRSMAPLFAGEIWDHFVRPLANRSARSAFLAPPTPPGPKNASQFTHLATVDETRQALAATPTGDVVTFAEKLFELAGGPARNADKAAFVAETISTFNSYHSWLHLMAQEASNALDKSVVPPQHLMNAREFDEGPSEWFTYQRYDLHSIRSLLNQMALHGAFGRDLEAAGKLWKEGDGVLETRENQLVDIVNATTATPGTNPWERRKEAKALAVSRGLNLAQLERSSKDRAMAKYELTNFQAWVKAHGGVALEFKWWSQLLSAAVAWTVQGPKTAFIDTTSLFKPIQEIGFSTQSLGWTMRNIKSTAMQLAGGFVEIFGKTLRWEADKIRMLHEMGQFPSVDQFSIKERFVAAVMANSASPNAKWSERAASAASIASAGAREVLNMSLPKAASDPQFIAIKPAAFTMMSQSMHLGTVMGTWGTFEDMVVRAARWLNNPTNRPQREDPTFRFDKQHAEALGYGKRFFGLLDDAASFESLLAKLNQNGMTLEQLAKAYLNRGMTGQIMDTKSYERMMTIATTELMMESSIASRASWLLSNPLAHTAIPLVGWSIAQTGTLSKLGRKDVSGEMEKDWSTVKRFFLKLAPIMGVSLAYSLLADWYDEEVLKKKSNRLTFSGDNAFMAALDKFALTGVLGAGGELANATINVSTAREFTIDSRVFAVSAFQGIWKALSTWYHQGEASYSTVGRPLAQSLGLGGALQYLQIVNGLLGLDNPESRATARIDVNNWLRVGGRGNGLEVKTGRGSQYIASRTTPWVREMALAAMAGDRREFLDSYRAALDAARADKREDPVDYVKRAYQAQNPLRSVFETRISESEYRKLLLSLPETGRRNVSEAVRLINMFGEGLGIEPYYGTREPLKPKALNLDKILRGAALTPSF